MFHHISAPFFDNMIHQQKSPLAAAENLNLPGVGAEFIN